MSYDAGTNFSQARLSAGITSDAGIKERAASRFTEIVRAEARRIRLGMGLLATIGATSPFVGLFGTVWGILNALTAIGIAGQASIDRVAGPVGEALIMTALGLAVAIPAVLAYNAFVRSNRLALARLDAFAHDLFAVLATGSHVVKP